MNEDLQYDAAQSEEALVGEVEEEFSQMQISQGSTPGQGYQRHDEGPSRASTMALSHSHSMAQLPAPVSMSR